MTDIQIVATSTNVNTFLKVGDQLFNIYRVNMDTGIIRVAQAKSTTTALRPLENLEAYGVTFDGVICKIAESMSHEDIINIIRKELKREERNIRADSVVTTDGYYPCLRVGKNRAIGVKREGGGEYELYTAFAKMNGEYNRLVTDRCYFSDAFRLIMPMKQMLDHVLKNLGWLADPYDWETFEWADKKKWVELPPIQ